jgi:hypothetical protein
VTHFRRDPCWLVFCSFVAGFKWFDWRQVLSHAGLNEI